MSIIVKLLATGGLGIENLNPKYWYPLKWMPETPNKKLELVAKYEAAYKFCTVEDPVFKPAKLKNLHSSLTKDDSNYALL